MKNNPSITILTNNAREKHQYVKLG